jgi:hypothetical protein
MAITAQYLQQQITLLVYVVHLAVAVDSLVVLARAVQQVQHLVVLLAAAVEVDSVEFELPERFLKFLVQLSQSHLMIQHKAHHLKLAILRE